MQAERTGFDDRFVPNVRITLCQNRPLSGRANWRNWNLNKNLPSRIDPRYLCSKGVRRSWSGVQGWRGINGILAANLCCCFLAMIECFDFQVSDNTLGPHGKLFSAQRRQQEFGSLYSH